MSGLWHDIRQAARSLLGSPGFTIIAVLTLAIGIGANTAIFSVVHSVLLEPLPFPDAERLVRVYDGAPGLGGTASPPDFEDWRAENTVFDQMAAYVRTAGVLSGAGEAQRFPGAVVTGGFFSVLGTAPMLGRSLSQADAETGAERVVVLSHRLWQRHFGGDRAIVGRSVRLEGRDYAVVGVMPPAFDYPAGADLWLPLSFSEEELATQRGAHYLDVFARLAPGASVQEASAQMAAIADLLESRYPETNTGATAHVVGLHDALVGEVRPALLMLLGAVGFVLLIGCANVANLVLVRTAGRQRELAVRNALGAGRGRLVRHVLTESLLLAFAGGAAGVLVAAFGLKLLLALPVEGMPRLGDAGLDGTVLAFTAVVSMLTGVLFGLLPALRAALAPDLTVALKSGGGAVTTDRAGGRARSTLIVTEMALAVLLLTGAGLLLKSFTQLQRVDPGFNPDGVLTFELALPNARYPEPQQSRAFFEQFTERLQALPGVQSAAGVFGLPLTGFSYVISVERLDGAPAYDAPGEERHTGVRVVTPDYFRAMEIPLREGRVIETADRSGTEPVVVVNESAAELLWPGDEAVGRSLELGTTMGLGGPRLGGRVVGVVADFRHEGLADAPAPEIFVAHRQFPVDFMSLVVRTSRPPLSLVPEIAAVLRRMDGELPLDDVRTMQDRVAASVGQPRLYTLLLSIFAAAALVLAAIGIYGVLAYAVRQRSNEIGIRRALGASGGDVLRMVLRRALELTAMGLVIGLVAALVVTRLLAAFLYGVSTTDPFTFIAVAVLLVGVALLASLVPARRAARLDPMAALREE